MARGAHFNADVDPRLLRAIEANEKFGKYGTRMTSGYRPGDSRFHGKHSAVDLELIGEDGAALDNYQNPENAVAYQQYANQLYNWALANDPGLAKELRWGGYFSGGKGKYGALDLMHFDTGGDTTGMAGGSWEGGFNEQQAKQWGLQAGGGIDPNAVAQAKAAGYTDEQIRAAFLSTIASGESPGYDVLYGGEKFSDFSKHPGRMMPILDKQGQVTGHSDTAGRYQFKGSTWAEEAAKHGYKDFKPETQDLAAWNYASEIYKRNTNGGDIMEALKSGDAGRINAASQVLNKVWSSLPGGAEQGKGYGKETFYDIYSKNLGTAGSGAGTPAAGTPTAGYDPKFPDKPDEPKKTDWGKYFTKFGEDMGKGGMSANMPSYNLPAGPAAALAANTPTTIGTLGGESDKRAELTALIMQRLNSGKLF